jgi:hypothetical protein
VSRCYTELGVDVGVLGLAAFMRSWLVALQHSRCQRRSPWLTASITAAVAVLGLQTGVI